MEKIVFLDRSSLIANLSQPNFQHTWIDFPTTSETQTLERIQNATIIITNKVKILRSHLEQCPNLKLIAVCATGTNNIDLEACKEFNVKVCNIRGYAKHTVPEHVFSLIFALRRNIIAYRETLLAGKWQKADFFCLFDHPIDDLYGSTLGIIGSGDLGDSIATLAKAFGMNVLKADRKFATEIREGYTSFVDVIKQSDIISLHCPLTPETQNLISTPEFNLMKSKALLINTARGGIVNEFALFTAIMQKQIGGAGIDVLSEEPPVNSSPLLDSNFPNLIVTPHVAWASRQAMQILGNQLIENINLFIKNAPQNIVV